MKTILIALPLCTLLTYCTSSRKAVAPAPNGISNVNVTTNGSTIAASSVAVTPENRDWAYRATLDTTLKGEWALHGIMTADGWSTTDTWYPQDTISADSVALAMERKTETYRSMSATMETRANKNAKSSQKKGTAARNTTSNTTAKNTSFEQALNGTINTTGNLEASVEDTAAATNTLATYRYWNRIPQIAFNPTQQVFVGNTGCNSISGSFNFNEKDIAFRKNFTTSKMDCFEYDESVFLEALKKVDNYTINGNMLELRQGDTLLLTFVRK